MLVQMISSFLCLYGLYVLRPFLSLESTQSAGVPDTGGICPLILVHPALQNRAAWYFYQAAFRKAGFTSIHYFEYSCREHSLSDVAERLAVLVNDVAALSPDDKPVLIGASLGGLVARAALCFPGVAENLSGLITLACPHKGSSLAKLAPKRVFPLLHGIVYGGPGIEALEAKERTAAGTVPKTAFFSCRDEIVRPVSALYPPAHQTWREVETMPISHMTIMLHKQTIDSVINELN